ncbi:hypothetical protein [Flectobacillus longus]|uniref:hypothetical protein n=1 Tax=Flectobacillus longus TaxID=2984207 RepID=UPI0024B70BBC|nr:hypothetical protein [Flectobacillus longus]MDI9878018.1 hypothetical protein [Flectobacillus longus]
MKYILSQPIFNHHTQNFKALITLAWGFFPFIALLLFIDSPYFVERFFEGRYLADVLTILYFSSLFKYSDAHLRKLLFIMVFLSYLGELIFCNGVGMYDYRTPYVPFYVPFGHSIVYATGYIFAKNQWVIKHDNTLRSIFIAFYALVFLSVGYFLNDDFSLLFGLLFFILVRRKRWQNVYFFIGLAVFTTELIGTYYNCWTWRPITYGGLATANPPMGAVFFYGGGDVLLDKIVWYYERKIQAI